MFGALLNLISPAPLVIVTLPLIFGVDTLLVRTAGGPSQEPGNFAARPVPLKHSGAFDCPQAGAGGRGMCADMPGGKSP